MEPSADKPQNTQTGNLEQLFRQKFEEAEIAPRASLWEQIDHDLLVQQNENYRQRLQLHRWAAAACLLFALAMGAWFTIHLTGTHEADLAAASSADAAGNAPRLASNAGSGVAPVASPASTAPAAEGAYPATLATTATSRSQKPSSSGKGGAPTRLATLAAPSTISADATVASKAGVGPQNRVYQGIITDPNGLPSPAALEGSAGTLAATMGAVAVPETAETTLVGSSLADEPVNTGHSATQAAATTQASAQIAYQSQLVAPTALSGASTEQSRMTQSVQSAAFGNQPAAEAANQPATIAALLPRESALTTSEVALPATLQPMYLANSLAWADALAKEDEKQRVATKGWSFGGGHAVSAFNPNMNFSRGSLASTNVRISSTAMVNAQMYEAGAQEYRENLQAGLGQRIMLLARRRISNRFSISAGAEAAEYRASSQTSYAALESSVPTTFTGDFASTDRVRTQMATDLTVLNEPQKTRYRYRSAGVPVLVQYGNNAKNGWSFYARMGAAVNVLFGTRFSADDNMLVAQKSYSLQSGDSPYRKVLTSFRSGAGLSYRPAGAAWSLAFGPAAEAGLNTLNVDPTQSYWQQSRPYSLGLEASVEFGSKSAPVLAVH